MSEDFKVVVVVLLGAIVVSLGKALFHMSSGKDSGGEMVKALSWRVGLSLTLFAILMGGYYLHLIAPRAGP